MTQTNIPSVTLNNGVKMPQLGLGTWQSQGKEVELAVTNALESGYRMIDTAAVYDNEKSVGRAIKASGIARKELFITTKLWNSDQGAQTISAVEKSLERLGVSYIDLLLIHWPAPAADKYVETWHNFEKLYADRRAHSIGVSNFKPHHLEKILEAGSVIPTVNQIELHPHFQQAETVEFCHKHGIQIESYSPIGGAGGNLLAEPALQELASKHNKSPAQIVIRWHLQKDFVVIPKATKMPHIKENADVFDFKLDTEDMQKIATLETGKKRLPDPDTFNSGIKTGLVQLAHKFGVIHTGKEK